jgi:hypothetical protein
MRFFLKEAWQEFRHGLGSGVVGLIFLVLVAYLLLVLCNADYLRDMGAVDVPRNAPALVYLMSSGMSFFLFFAWAWVFAQPVLRDRSVGLHEVVLACPVSLRQLLAARFVGAFFVAVLLGSSQIVGFYVAPVLEWVGAVPAGSFAPAPWLAFGWGMLLFIIPLSLGSGALYFMAAIRSRGLGGPFAVAAALMGFWMVSMIILKDGNMDPFYFSLLDPSGYAETEHQVMDHWTPHEKSTALLALTPALIWNRILWCGIPPLFLALVILLARREWLVLDRSPEKRLRHKGPFSVDSPGAEVPGPVDHPFWLRAAGSEALWQMKEVLTRKWLWIAMIFLVLLGVAGAFVHGVYHDYGPMAPRPELVTPLLSTMFYLIIVFMLAGLTGLAARRDAQAGMEEMLDAAPSPGYVRFSGRILSMGMLTLLLAMVPACGGMLTTLFVEPGSLNLLLPFLHQLFVMVPALLEIGAMTLLLHALILRPGPAYAASMLAAFIMIVNHEAHLVTYPPFQIGLQTPIAFSGLTGLGPWMEKLLIFGFFKLCVAALLLSMAAMVLKRGTDTGFFVRWLRLKKGLRARPGMAALASVCGLLACGILMHQRYVVDGGYETLAETLAGDAAWETIWLDQQAAFSLEGGHVTLNVDPVKREVHGWWRMEGFVSESGFLHAGLPHGLNLTSALVQGREVKPRIQEDHMALALENCPAEGCEVLLGWSVSLRGWDADGEPPWLLPHAFWLHGPDVMPRLGLDAGRVLRTPKERERFGLKPEPELPAYASTFASGAAAPGGQWSFEVRVVDGDREIHVEKGRMEGLLDFAHVWGPGLRESQHGNLRMYHDASRRDTASSVAADVLDMQACVARRTGRSPEIRHIAQWPRNLGETRVAGNWLILTEDPHWDVKDRGTGRWLRRSAIAKAMVQRVLRDGSDLREGEGALWLEAGLPGAMGIWCVAETDGMEAFSALLSHGSDQVARRLAGSTVPVTTLKLALKEGGWAEDYAPLAALDWTGRQTAQSLASLMEDLKKDTPLAVLKAHAGAEMAAAMLGEPRSADIRVTGGEETPQLIGEHWLWERGGWVSVEAPLRVLGYAMEPGRVMGEKDTPGGNPGKTSTFYLDAWPSYERVPADNLWSFRP